MTIEDIPDKSDPNIGYHLFVNLKFDNIIIFYEENLDLYDEII
jgi:hypothetical protein